MKKTLLVLAMFANSAFATDSLHKISCSDFVYVAQVRLNLDIQTQSFQIHRQSFHTISGFQGQGQIEILSEKDGTLEIALIENGTQVGLLKAVHSKQGVNQYAESDLSYKGLVRFSSGVGYPFYCSLK